MDLSLKTNNQSIFTKSSTKVDTIVIHDQYAHENVHSGYCQHKPSLLRIRENKRTSKTPAKARKSLLLKEQVMYNYRCNCSVCLEQCKSNSKFKTHGAEKEKYFEGLQKDFIWLLEHLTPPSDKYKGCCIRIADILHFTRTETDQDLVAIKTERDSYVGTMKNFNKFTFHQLKQDILRILKKIETDDQETPNKIYGKVIESTCVPPDRSNYFRDPAISQFWDTPSKILRYPDDYSQLVFKNEVRGVDNIEKKTIVKFYAPILEQHPRREIQYDFKRMGDPEDLNNQELCHYYCLKICDYVKTMHGIEILKFKAHFQADSHGKLYLSFVKDITIKNSTLKIDGKMKEKYLKKIHSKVKDIKPEELDTSVDLPLRKITLGMEHLNKDSSPLATKLHKVMTDHYKKL
ncbi:unnamed protein product [Moneuplotes crassus]|uniref:Uncharacterized protein n=1 Tax=Euplotes crassus TaxID=5936 RepID=A0AAD2DCI8_EUPCR|nr:unnamed protein product [Moneuplotes crassus]